LLRNLFKSETLYIEILESYINIRVIDKRDVIKTYINIQLPEGIIENGKVKNSSYIEKAITEHMSTVKEKYNKAVLVVDVYAIMRFADFPNLENKKLISAVQYSFAEHFPVDLSLYTTDYRKIYQTEDKSRILLLSIEKDIVYSYLSIFENINIRLDVIDAYSNFISLYLGEYDKGNIVVGILRGNNIIIQFIENGELNHIQESSYTDLDFLFRGVDIERAYLPEGTKEEMINFLSSQNIEVICMKYLVPIGEQSVLKTRDFWE